MPESRKTVNSQETSVCSNVNIAIEPQRRLLVPRSGKYTQTRSRFKFENIHVVGDIPSFGLALFIESFESRIPKIIRTFGILPCKVILVTMEKESYHEVGHALEPRLLKELRLNNNREVFLWIRWVLQRKLRANGDERSHAVQTDKERLERRPQVARDFSSGLAIRCVEQCSVASILVANELVRRSCQNVRKAKAVAEKLDKTWHFLESKGSTLLRGPRLLALGEDLTVVEIVGQHVEFLSQNHLGSGKIKIPSQVVDVLSVKMAKDQVEKNKGRYELARNASRERNEHGVGNHTVDELMNPLNTDCKLQEEGSEEEGEQVTHNSVGKQIHDHTQRVAEEQSQRVIERFNIESNAISEILDVGRNKRRNYVHVKGEKASRDGRNVKRSTFSSYREQLSARTLL